MTPTGSRLLPRRSAATAPASIVSVPFGSSEPAIHFLRDVTGLAGVGEQPQGPAGAAGGGDLGGLDLGHHAAARELGGRAAGGGLDLRRDALDQRDELGVRV